eukprot:gene3607-10284_t
MIGALGWSADPCFIRWDAARTALEKVPLAGLRSAAVERPNKASWERVCAPPHADTFNAGELEDYTFNAGELDLSKTDPETPLYPNHAGFTANREKRITRGDAMHIIIPRMMLTALEPGAELPPLTIAMPQGAT